MLTEHVEKLDEILVGFALIPNVNAGAIGTDWGPVIRLQAGLIYPDNLNQWLLSPHAILSPFLKRNHSP